VHHVVSPVTAQWLMFTASAETYEQMTFIVSRLGWGIPKFNGKMHQIRN